MVAWRVPWSWWGVIVLLALVAVLTLPSDDSLGQIPAIDVSIDDVDRDQTSRVTDVKNEVLTFHGEVTLNKPVWIPGTTVTLELELEMPRSDGVWEVNFDPPEGLVYTASSTQNFSAQVTVPEGLPASLQPHLLVFNASTSDILFYTVTTGTANVYIAQFYKISRQYSTKPLRVKQGQSVEFNITLINRGNGADTFSVEVTNEDELNLRKVFVFFDRQKRISAGEQAIVRFRLQTEDDALEGEFSLNVTIRSETSSTDPHHDLVTSGAEWTVVVEPSLTSTIIGMWYYVVGGVVVLVVVGFFLVRRRRLKAMEEGGDEGEDGGEDTDEDEFGDEYEDDL